MIQFFCTTVFAIWVVFFGGAERLEGTLLSLFVIDAFAPFLKASLLKIYVVAILLGDLLLLVIRTHQ